MPFHEDVRGIIISNWSFITRGSTFCSMHLGFRRSRNPKAQNVHLFGHKEKRETWPDTSNKLSFSGKHWGKPLTSSITPLEMNCSVPETMFMFVMFVSDTMSRFYSNSKFCNVMGGNNAVGRSRPLSPRTAPWTWTTWFYMHKVDAFTLRPWERIQYQKSTIANELFECSRRNIWTPWKSLTAFTEPPEFLYNPIWCRIPSFSPDREVPWATHPFTPITTFWNQTYMNVFWRTNSQSCDHTTCVISGVHVSFSVCLLARIFPARFVGTLVRTF